MNDISYVLDMNNSGFIDTTSSYIEIPCTTRIYNDEEEYYYYNYHCNTEYLISYYKNMYIIEQFERKRKGKYKFFHNNTNKKYNNDPFIYDEKGNIQYKIYYESDVILEYYEKNNYCIENFNSEINFHCKKDHFNTSLHTPFSFKDFKTKFLIYKLREEVKLDKRYKIITKRKYDNIVAILEDYTYDFRCHKGYFKNVLNKELLLEVQKYIWKPENINYYVKKYGVDDFENYM